MMLMNKWFRITVDPVLDAGSQATEFVHVISDITGHRKLEEQLRQSQKLEAVGQLAGGVAHDFNNILTAIIGYAHVMTIKMQPDNPLRHHAAQILEVSDRAAALTQSLLAFSRNHPVYLEALDLNKVVESFKKFLLRVIREDITLRTQFADKAVPIMADRGQIEQILMNLITNARDEIPRGGSIMIDTMLVQIDNEFIQAHGFGKPGQYALLTIADTGRGMDEETRGKIFEPFFTTKDVGKGTGLGLSIVYGIVKGHEGFINVYSEPGKGTTFKIYLPAVSDSRLQKADLSDQRAEIQEPQPAKGETILIAEDNESVRKLSRLVLEGVGYIVIEAVDGQEAVQKFIENKDRVQLVILDAIMPVKNGKEAYNEIKAVNPDIKAIFTSGHIEEIIMQQEAADTEVPFLVKPASPSNLLKKVREALDKK
jgi:signal transduction histidine kinase